MWKALGPGHTERAIFFPQLDAAHAPSMSAVFMAAASVSFDGERSS